MIKQLMGVLVCAVALNMASAYGSEEDEHKQEQARLDGICEAARQQALEPRRQEIFDECVEKFKKDEATCTAEASGYNGSQVGRSPLFYDLPECEEAHDYRNSYRNSSS